MLSVWSNQHLTKMCRLDLVERSSISERILVSSNVAGLQVLCDIHLDEIPVATSLPSRGRLIVFGDGDDDIKVRTVCVLEDQLQNSQWRRSNSAEGEQYPEVSVEFKASISLQGSTWRATTSL